MKQKGMVRPMAGGGRTSDAISPTGYYTGQVWVEAGLAPAAFATREGTVFYQSLRPMNAVSRAMGGPSIEQLLLARHRTIDHELAQAIDAGTVSSVIEIACGLSGRGARFAQRYGEHITYVEADLPAMAARKRDLLTAAGLDSIADHHRVVDIDALVDDGPASLAEIAAELDPAGGVAIITEGLLNYFPPAAVAGMWRRFVRALAGFPAGLYLADIHLGEDTKGVAASGFAALLSAFVRGKVHIHFRDIAECRRELDLAGFGRADLLRPEELPEITGPIDPASARRVRIIEARTGAAEM
jgi:O-methyltransferase involved in polyketide biosynthesis